MAVCSCFVGSRCAEVTAERSERGVVVKIDGKLFTEYLTKAGQSPAMWPIIGPTGKAMTRSYPFNRAEGQDGHQRPSASSIAVVHARQGERRRLLEGKRNDDKGDNGPHIAHREFVEVDSDGETATIVTRNDWMNGDKRICEDERTIVFGTRPNGDRWIDFTITIKATDGDVTFGDTKEGTFACASPTRCASKPRRAAASSTAKAKRRSRLGHARQWVDYTGPVTVAASLRDRIRSCGPSEDVLGIAIMSHPKSFRPVPRWHVRTYGLFAANPFGQRDFPKPEAAKQGAYTIKKGDSITLRYRVLLASRPNRHSRPQRRLRRVRRPLNDAAAGTWQN